MSSIKSTTIKDLLDKVIDNRGRNPSYYSEAGYYVLDNYLINSTRYPREKDVRRFIDQHTHDVFLRKYLKKNDVCITLVGNGIGSVCLAPSEEWVTIQNTIGLRTDSSTNPEFLYYFLKLIKPSVVNLDRGSSQPSILQGDLLQLKINVIDSYSQQQKIGSILSALDDKIELNYKINAELEQMARTLYDYWFVQFDFPNSQGKPYKSSGGTMKFSPELKREIPEGWQSLKLQDALEFEKGTEPGAAAYSDIQDDEFELPFYRVGDIKGETDTFINSKKFKVKTVKPSDVIVTFDGSVGKMGLGLNGAISGGLRHIYDKTGKISNAGVYAIFGNGYITKTIERYATGSVILHASSSIPYLAIPYHEEIFSEFQRIIEPMFAKMIANRQESQKLAHLRDWLLPMLMNGQVSVE